MDRGVMKQRSGVQLSTADAIRDTALAKQKQFGNIELDADHLLVYPGVGRRNARS